mmetsp:Transcript_20001/g.30388  ORF Transcript_20001/g.30388 Transcript_20001/m.30388 type:complete len:92 (-) Transcript_20001:218-493(-)
MVFVTVHNAAAAVFDVCLCVVCACFLYLFGTNSHTHNTFSTTTTKIPNCFCFTLERVIDIYGFHRIARNEKKKHENTRNNAWCWFNNKKEE